MKTSSVSSIQRTRPLRNQSKLKSLKFHVAEFYFSYKMEFMQTFIISMVLLFVLSASYADSELCMIVAANNVTYLPISDTGQAGIFILDSNTNVFACSYGICVKIANLAKLTVP